MTKYDKPWGYYENLSVKPEYLVKRIVVFPEARLSLQTHDYRKEHWVVVKGEALVRIGDLEKKLKAGECAEIGFKQVHRLSNVGKSDLVVIETQYGICREDDIHRLEDIYGR